MPAQTDQPLPADATAALDGIVALLAAEGLNDDQIAAVTGRDAEQVRSRAAGASQTRELSVIERARMHMEANAAR